MSAPQRKLEDDAVASDLLRELPRQERPRGAKVFPGARLFREAALEAYVRGDQGSTALHVAPPGTRALLWLALSIVVAALLTAFVAHVDVTSRAVGILQVKGGAQVISAQSPGIVENVLAHSGDVVAQNDVILTLDSASMKASLLAADRRVELAKTQLEHFEKQRKSLFSQRKALLVGRIGLLKKRIKSQDDSITRLEAKLVRYQLLVREGVATSLDLEQVAEEKAQALRQKLNLQEEISETELQSANVAFDIDTELRTLTLEVERAQAERDALSFSLEQRSIKAPRPGRLEAVLVHRGDSLTAGSAIGELVPNDASLQIVSFIRERDRAFLKIGASARVELDQLPVAEFGSLQAKVTRIASDISSADEVREVLGDHVPVSGPVLRVELELEKTPQAEKLSPYIRPGSVLNVRYALRQRRVITLLIEPLRRWLE